MFYVFSSTKWESRRAEQVLGGWSWHQWEVECGRKGAGR
jgi:hypothetical protein